MTIVPRWRRISTVSNSEVLAPEVARSRSMEAITSCASQNPVIHQPLSTLTIVSSTYKGSARSGEHSGGYRDGCVKFYR